ncbi:hypothetical protein FRB94_014649 [Tulasnella sp. JGI-2019a]|nr:hypothetical protein FRB93_002462 [Tulasnella sp. JGI-2019a]KAG9007081.1 hypothetical protein FRB94_014649 [Tulasnella sp. JGI-2019a]KAG9033187.1 hypothetical protein FRB95_000442 [Tulasnella sp. JGI-2019a]
MNNFLACDWKTPAAWLAVTAYAFIWAIGLVGWRTARRRYRSRPASPLQSSSDAPGVSILRPLKGLDWNLFENLESTCRQRYPKFEIIFSVADENDQALQVIEELRQKYPEVVIKVIIGAEDVGVNPKVNNLMRPYKQATYDILWVLDSNVIMDPGALARAVDALLTQRGDKPIGLVHHVPFAITYDHTGLGNRVEEAFLNTNHAKMYLAINTVALESCVTGKSCMYRRSDLERVNASFRPADIPSEESWRGFGERRGYGMEAFGRFMAEDAMIGLSVWHELGKRHDLSCDIAKNVLAKMSFMDYVWRRVRWIRVRKNMVFAATLAEPLTESIVVGLYGAWAISHLTGGGIPMWLMLLVHFSCWITVDLDVYMSLAGHPVPKRQQMGFFQAWCIRELCAFPIWAVAMFGNTIEWRGNLYRMKKNGEAAVVEGPAESGYEAVPTAGPGS